MHVVVHDSTEVTGVQVRGTWAHCIFSHESGNGGLSLLSLLYIFLDSNPEIATAHFYCESFHLNELRQQPSVDVLFSLSLSDSRSIICLITVLMFTFFSVPSHTLNSIQEGRRSLLAEVLLFCVQ